MTIQTAMLELQTKLYERLSLDPIISAKVEGVFDYVEEGQTFPYITIGEPSMLPFTTKSKFGEELSIVIHSWSTYTGKKESYEILNLCLTALASRMDLNGFTIEKVDIDQIRVIDDADPRIKHGILRMKYTIQNN
jgi:hypothetical protein